MDKNFSTNVEALKHKFNSFSSPDDRYSYIIELGRALPPYPPEFKTSDRIVPGCQSTLYLHTTLKEGKLFCSAQCDALISLGLAALLISIYSGCDAKTILLNPPAFLQELGIFSALSPSRSNGLISIYTKMKKEALLSLTNA